MAPKEKEVVVVDQRLKRGRPGKMGANEGRFSLEFPAIGDKIRELGTGYIFNELERCNLTL
ncbi:hypothetical protein HAX54_040970, partial [Datura stramonium]|nr:hypothetical protein [Datura stramonium]